MTNNVATLNGFTREIMIETKDRVIRIRTASTRRPGIAASNTQCVSICGKSARASDRSR